MQVLSSLQINFFTIITIKVVLLSKTHPKLPVRTILDEEEMTLEETVNALIMINVIN